MSFMNATLTSTFLAGPVGRPVGARRAPGPNQTLLVDPDKPLRSSRRLKGASLAPQAAPSSPEQQPQNENTTNNQAPTQARKKRASPQAKATEKRAPVRSSKRLKPADDEPAAEPEAPKPKPRVPKKSVAQLKEHWETLSAQKQPITPRGPGNYISSKTPLSSRHAAATNHGNTTLDQLGELEFDAPVVVQKSTNKPPPVPKFDLPPSDNSTNPKADDQTFDNLFAPLPVIPDEPPVKPVEVVAPVSRAGKGDLVRKYEEAKKKKEEMHAKRLKKEEAEKLKKEEEAAREAREQQRLEEERLEREQRLQQTLQKMVETELKAKEKQEREENERREKERAAAAEKEARQRMEKAREQELRELQEQEQRELERARRELEKEKEQEERQRQTLKEQEEARKQEERARQQRLLQEQYEAQLEASKAAPRPAARTGRARLFDFLKPSAPVEADQQANISDSAPSSGFLALETQDSQQGNAGSSKATTASSATPSQESQPNPGIGAKKKDTRATAVPEPGSEKKKQVKKKEKKVVELEPAQLPSNHTNVNNKPSNNDYDLMPPVDSAVPDSPPKTPGPAAAPKQRRSIDLMPPPSPLVTSFLKIRAPNSPRWSLSPVPTVPKADPSRLVVIPSSPAPASSLCESPIRVPAPVPPRPAPAPKSPLELSASAVDHIGEVDDMPLGNHKPGDRPAWTKGPALLEALRRQASVDPDTVFPPIPKIINLQEIFQVRNEAYNRRSSSANWAADRVTQQEELNYKLAMGWKK